MKFDYRHVMLMKEAFLEIFNIDDQPIIKGDDTIISEAIGSGMYYHRKKRTYKLFEYNQDLDLKKDKVFVIDEFDNFREALRKMLFNKCFSGCDFLHNPPNVSNFDSEHVEFTRQFLKERLNIDEDIVIESDDSNQEHFICFKKTGCLITDKTQYVDNLTLYWCDVFESRNILTIIPRFEGQKYRNAKKMLKEFLIDITRDKIVSFLMDQQIEKKYKKILSYRDGHIHKKQELVHRLLSS